jgi:hypothetical protein
MEGASSAALRALFDASLTSKLWRSGMKHLFLGLDYFKNSSQTREL